MSQFRVVAVLLALSLAASQLPAHGGGYTPPPPPPDASGGRNAGPGDVVPPGPTTGGPRPAGPTGPTTGGPAGPGPGKPLPATTGGPATPTPAGPTTGGPSSPPSPGAGPARPAPGGPTTPRGGIVLEEDGTRWDLWWDLHQDAFLRRKDALQKATVQTGSDEFFLGGTLSLQARNLALPSAGDADRIVLPALVRALQGSSQRDVVTAAMVALAKVGRDPHGAGSLSELLLPRLSDNDQEVRETAALALGIAGQTGHGQIELLAALAADDAAGRAACRRTEVDVRTRAFACYGLGLLAGSAATVADRFRAVQPLLQLVADERLRQRDVKAAAILGLGMLAAGGPGDAALRALAVQALGDYWQRDLGPTAALAQAQCPPVIARLCVRDGAAAAAWRQRFADGLRRRGLPAVQSQSCALALGELCRPGDGKDDDDAPLRLLLAKTFANHGDLQTRYFAAMALGRIGGGHARELLLDELGRAQKALELPWLALALGVQAHGRRQRGEVDHPLGAILRQLLGEVRNPSTLGAVAIAVGLCGDPAARPDLQALLGQRRGDDQLAGQLCLALALLGDRGAVDDLRQVLQESARRPLLLQRAAVALGVLGDHDVTDDLLALLRTGDVNLARLSAAAVALGMIGDRRTLQPLASLLDDEALVALSRALCAAALGNVCDRRPLPWNMALRDYANYRASIPTLWDGSAGILDIL